MSDLLSQAIATAVRKPEVIEAMCQALAIQLEAQLRKDLGKSQEYIAAVSDRAGRAMQIRALFTGNNVAELSKQFDLTPRRIRQILGENKK